MVYWLHENSKFLAKTKFERIECSTFLGPLVIFKAKQRDPQKSSLDI